MPAVFVLVFIVFMAMIFVAAARTATKRKDALGQIAHLLGGGSDGSSASGTRNGLAVTYRFATRGSGSSSESWTEVELALPPYPLSVNLRRHGWFDRGKIERGEMVDVQLGDPPFDERFLVEAAPADVVRVLLDDPTRRYLMAQSQVELTTERVTPRIVLRLAIRGWIEDLDAATGAIDMTSRIASRVRDAFAQLEQAHAPTDAGSPYRPHLDDTASRDAAAARADEVARVEALRADRQASAKAVGWVLFAVFMMLWIVIALR